MDRDKLISILRTYFNQGWLNQMRYTPLIGTYIDIFGKEEHKQNKQLFLDTIKESPRYHRYCLEYAIDELVNYFSVVKIVKTYPTPSGGISEEIITVY